MKKILFLVALVFGFSLPACKDELSFESVESGRVQANENSEYNAKAFRQTHNEYAGYSISMRGDSTQSAKCGQGDGWASIDLINIDKNAKIPIKCSTTSSATGCMLKEDFESRSYAKQEGECDTSIPFPLPKIQK